MKNLLEVGTKVTLVYTVDDDLRAGLVKGETYVIKEVDPSDEFIYCIGQEDASFSNWGDVWGYVTEDQIEKVS